MNFFTGLLLFFGLFWLVSRLFGRQILGFLIKQAVKRVQKDAERQSEAYRRNYDQDPFHESIFIDDDVKVSTPVRKTKRKIHPDEIAEDTDFEEVN